MSQIEEKDSTWSVTRQAHELVYGDRNKSYGHPADDYTRTAKLWSAILGIDISPKQAALCMVALKVSRLCNDPDHHDSIVDIAGYAEVYNRIGRRERGLE